MNEERKVKENVIKREEGRRKGQGKEKGVNDGLKADEI